MVVVCSRKAAGGGASKATGLAAEVEVELVDEVDDEADAVLAVL